MDCYRYYFTLKAQRYAEKNISFISVLWLSPNAEGSCFTETIIMFMNNTGQPNIIRKSTICHISLTAYSQTIRVSKLKTTTMGKKLNGRLFRVNGKAFRINGEVLRVRGKVFHIVFSPCEGSFLGSIGMFGPVICRLLEV